MRSPVIHWKMPTGSGLAFWPACSRAIAEILRRSQFARQPPEKNHSYQSFASVMRCSIAAPLACHSCLPSAMSTSASPFFFTPDALTADTAHGDEAHYRSLIDDLPEPLLVLQDEQIVFANPAAARLLGLPTPTAMLGLPISSLIAPGYHAICEQCKQATFSGTPRAAPISMKLQRADASLVEVEPLTFASHYQGRPAILAVLRDLTERRRIEQAAERFRIALDSSPDLVCLIDPERMRFLDVNDSACTSLGYTREEMLDIGPQDIKPHFNKAMLRRHFAEVLAGRHEAELLQTQHQRKDGSVFPVEIRLRPFASGGQALIVAVARDITERLRAEAQLREANERFQQLAENVSEIFWIRDLEENRYLYVSPAYQTLFGKSLDSLYRHPRSFLSSVHPEDRARVTTAFDQQRQDGHGINLEYRYLGQDGGIRWLWARTFPIQDASGRIYRMAGVAQDVTERRESEELYRTIIQTSMDGFLSTDTQGRLLDCNEAYCRMLGYSRTELLNMSIPDLEMHETLEDTRRHIEHIIERGWDSFETSHRRKDGQPQALEVNVYFRRDVQGGRFFSFLHDITERKRAEAALKESELRFRLLFEKSPIGIALADQDCHLIQANQALCDMLGYPAEELLGKTFIEITHPEDIASNLNLYNQAREGTLRDYALRKRYLRKDGGVVWANLTSTLIRDPAGAPLYSVGLVENITRQVNAEQERLAHEARQRDALVREVHHRIKNNLQGVIGLLRQHSTDHPETLAPIEAAIAQINTIAVVHGLQSRMPQNDLRLRELLREVCSAAAALAMVPRPPVLNDSLPGDALLDSNATVTLALILNELVHNALKHGSHASDNEVVITLCSDDSQVHLRIDNPGEPLPQGFDLANGHGCGTGLNLVRTLLPQRGANLNMRWHDGVVSTRLILSPPVITPPFPPAPPKTA